MAVALLPPDDGADQKLADAVHAWAVSSVFQSSMGVVYANSTVFEFYMQRVGGVDAQNSAFRYRRMDGSTLSGSRASNAIQVRPGWCGTYCAPNPALLSLLERALEAEDAGWLTGTLESLFLATKDAATTPERLEHSMYARTIEQLLNRDDDRKYGARARQQAYARELLSALLDDRRAVEPTFERVPFDTSRLTTLGVLEAVRDERNDFWHPKRRSSARKPFESQQAVNRNLIAFRAVVSLLIARLGQTFGEDTLEPGIRAFAPAVEQWIEGIKAQDGREPGEASALSRTWLRFRLRYQRRGDDSLETRVMETF